MISLKVKAETAEELRFKALSALGFPPNVIHTLLTDEPEHDAGDGPEVIDTTKMTAEQIKAAVTQSAPEPPKTRKPRATKSEASKREVLPAGSTDGDGAKPVFLEPEAKAEPEKAPEPPKAEVPTVDEVRAALEKVMDLKGMDAVYDIVKTFKAADGKPAAKTSQIQPQDRAAVIAAAEVVLGG
jgi:hypothetical protein